MPRYCSIPDCSNVHSSRGWCNKHYLRWRLHGDPLHVPTPAPIRFWTKVEFTGACWLWAGTINNKGYGIFAISKGRKRRVYAHRYAYEFCVGPIPGGLQLDHLCRVRHCVRPDHLDP